MTANDKSYPRTEEELVILEPTNATRRLIKATDNSVTEDGLKNYFNSYNLEEFIGKAGSVSGNLFWDNPQDSKLYLSETMKHDPNVKYPYHQYGIAYMVNIALLSRASDHKNLQHTWGDCVYLCGIYDQKLVDQLPSNREDLDKLSLRMNYERWRYELGPLSNLIGRNLDIYLEILPAIDSTIIEAFTKKHCMDIETYFKVAQAILTVAHHNFSQVRVNNIVGKVPHLDKILTRENIESFIAELGINYAGFRVLDKALNEKFPSPNTRTRFNPLYTKPLIISKKNKTWLPSVPIFLDRVFNGLFWWFDDNVDNFRDKYFGPAFETYTGRLLKNSFNNVVPEFKVGSKKEKKDFYDYCIVQDSKIYLIEVKSHSEKLEFKQTADFTRANAPNETVKKQILKLEYFSDSKCLDDFNKYLGEGWQDKEKILVFVFNDVPFISSANFQRQYFSTEVIELIDKHNVNFISIKDLEEYLIVADKINIEDVFAYLRSKQAIEIDQENDSPKTFTAYIRSKESYDFRNPYLLGKFDEFFKWTKDLTK